MRFVSIEGRHFVFDGKELNLHGLGVGSWLNLEHFMVGLPGLDGMIRSAMEQRAPGTMEAFQHSFFADEDAAYLASIGVNFLRVPVSYRLFWDDQTSAPRQEGIAALQRLNDICTRHKLFFMPDLHSTPGGQNPDWHSECATGQAQFWQYQAFRDVAASVWGSIAQALKDSEYLLGYDLLNEPLLPGPDKTLLNRFHADAVAAIRRHDPRHLVLVEGGRFAMDFSDVVLPDPGRSCYTYHFYPGVWEPALNDPQLSSQQRRDGFRRALEKTLHTIPGEGPLLCGEAGVELQTLGDEAGVGQLDDTLKVFDERGSSWCLWSYKDTGMMGLMVPRKDTPWQKLAADLSRHWNHHLDMERGDRFARSMGEACFGSLTEEEIYRVQFQLRAILFPLEKEHLLCPALNTLSDGDAAGLGQSFAFRSCRERLLYRQLLEKACKNY